VAMNDTAHRKQAVISDSRAAHGIGPPVYMTDTPPAAATVQ